ncbi:chemotaxis protein CheW [Aliikangiella sp. G2MR2-5]|uniref:chemotaxis protein CheW n=1 Tax=Aliikangiella sp. G2MR2-5 TaxID=2788943 RepID=UPI0018A9D84B|nr:chemotaxis protein CheW [Aliikangiella sp. G2MR2-5]
MKLNKPPVSQEQSLLEEYVDFLLTDRSNVTPIHAKKSLEASSSSEKNASEIPKLITIEKPKEESSKKSLSANKNGGEDGESTSSKNNIKEHSERSSIESEEYTSDFTTEPAKELNNESDKATEENLIKKPRTQFSSEGRENHEKYSELNLENDNKIHHQANDFSLEAEEEEAKKWDAVLTSEIENQLSRGDDVIKSNIDESIQKESFNLNVSNHEKIVRTNHVEAESSQINKIVDEYLPHKDERLAGVERLLARISAASQPAVNIPETELKSDSGSKGKVHTVSDEVSKTEISAKAAEATFQQRAPQKLKKILPNVFQTLIFKVGKMPLAVPLLKLGGIVKISGEDITPLVGTPDWFIGLVPNDRGNLMVVDTQRFLMPEQSSKPSSEMNYEYLILLDDSNWALACNSVGDAKNLTENDIRWSERSSRRPWFAGMVVDYMSALIEVDELINMLAETIVD